MDGSMTEKQPGAGDWIESWIEQQRRILHEQARGEPSLEELGKRWLDLGQTYLSGLASYGDGGDAAAGSPGPAAAQFKLGDDILSAWRNAWAGAEQEHAGMGRRFAEFADRMPFLGLAREQAQAWRELSAAQAECRRLSQELAAVLSRVQSDALSLLEQRVRKREQEGRPISDFRALYDLWVDCGEHVYGEVAHSDAYSRLQAELGNATMRLRSRQQAVLEHALKQFDLPTRTELNTVHLQLRELRTKLAGLEAASRTQSSTRRGRSGPAARVKKAPAKQQRNAKSQRKKK